MVGSRNPGIFSYHPPQPMEKHEHVNLMHKLLIKHISHLNKKQIKSESQNKNKPSIYLNLSLLLLTSK